jgi:hypothetical protein
MLVKSHIHWACVRFLKKILTRMSYKMKEKTKLLINVT